MKIWVDGSGYNGKISRYCILFEGSEPIIKVLKEKKTNNEMEYKALYEALRTAKGGETIYTDSQLVFGHLIKNWKQNYPHLREIAEKCKKLMTEKNINLVWIPREENKAGKILEGKQ